MKMNALVQMKTKQNNQNLSKMTDFQAQVETQSDRQ